MRSKATCHQYMYVRKASIYPSVNTGNIVDVFLSETPSSLLREWRRHFKDLYNYFDFLGSVLTILVIPLRFAEVNSQWSVAGLGYFLNFLGLFNYSCLSR